MRHTRKKLTRNISLWFDEQHDGSIHVIDFTNKIIDDSSRKGHKYMFGTFEYTSKNSILIKWPPDKDRKKMPEEPATFSRDGKFLTFTGGEFPGNKWTRINSGKVKDILIKKLRSKTVKIYE